MNARLAGSVWAPLGAQTQPRMRAHDIWCLHTMAGSFTGTDSMFHAGGYKGLESHQGVRADGYAEQWQDIAYTADANLNGNDVVISTETEDYGGVFGRWNLNDPTQIPAWTDAQVRTLIATGVQFCLPGTDPRSAHRDCPRDRACYREGIPAALIPDTKPGRRGIGYHAQGVPGVGLVPGGVQWSNARGKQCPGHRRIAQLKTLIIPGIQAALKNPTQGDDMPTPRDLWGYDGADGKYPMDAWRIVRDGRAFAAQAARDSAAALAIVKAQAAKGAALTADEIEAAAKAGAKAALDEEIAGATVNLNVQGK